MKNLLRTFTILFLQFAFAAAASAATLTVNSTLDEIDSNPGDGVCASAAGRCTLRAAVMESNILAGLDTILIPNGTYALTLKGSNEQLNATGDLDVNGPLVVKGTSQASTVIDGLFSDRVFELTSAEPFTISDLTIKNGYVPDPAGAIFNPYDKPIVVDRVSFLDNYTNSSGGAIYAGGPVQVSNSFFEGNIAQTAGCIFTSYGSNEASSFTKTTFQNNFSESFHTLYVGADGPVTLSEVTVLDNISTSTGGLYFSLGTGNLTIKDSTMSNNSSQGLGAVYYSGEGNVSITKSMFTNNHIVSGGVGAALHISTSATSNFTLEDITFKGNESVSGGADLYFTHSGTGATSLKRVTSHDSYCSDSGASCAMQLNGSGGSNLLIEELEIDSSYIPSGSAGALYLTSFQDATLRSVAITNSSIFTGTAGAMYISIGGNLTLEDSNISGNQLYLSGACGGVYASAGGNTLIRRSSIVDNTAIGIGATCGGMYLSGPSLTLENTTFSNNFGYVGGALFLNDPATIKNSTFYENVALAEASSIYSGADVHMSNTIVAGKSDIDHCKTSGTFISDGHNIESTNTCNFSAAGDLFDTNPVLSELRTTLESELPVHVPLAGSPAIDSGDIATCLNEDERGVLRPFDGDQNGSDICDIGAVELNDFCLDDDLKEFPGVCGCGIADSDSDGDGTFDCNDGCALDASKTAPGACGCGVADTNAFFPENAIADCQSGNEIKTAASLLTAEINKIKRVTGKTKKKKKKAIFKARKTAKALYKSLLSFLDSQASTVTVSSPDLSITALSKNLKKRVRKVFNVKKLTGKKKKQAIKSIEALSGAVV